MADMPFLQKGAARTHVQAKGMADEHNGVLVPSLPLLVEHLYHV